MPLKFDLVLMRPWIHAQLRLEKVGFRAVLTDLRARLDKADALIADGRPRKWFWQR